jgi:phospholipid/cholesterol/gamma-HCH transport system ATP-binding protein
MKRSDANFIVVKNLDLGYGDLVVLRDINFTINRGDIFVIMGMSGCGKSTIMRSVVGLLRPMRGNILVDGTDLWAVDDDARKKVIEKFGVSFQSGALFSSMTVGENVALPIELKSCLSAQKIRERVREKLKIVGMAGCENLYPAQISGGMIKRVALARALVTEPDTLFFDEPSAGLDPVRSAELDQLILDINRTHGTTIVMVTHELPTIMSIATNSVYIDCDTRSVASCGAPRNILNTTKNPQIIEFLTRGKSHGGKK